MPRWLWPQVYLGNPNRKGNSYSEFIVVGKEMVTTLRGPLGADNVQEEG
ncbi:MAG: hypothetical protein ACK4K2_01020 [Dehalococcoidia bacterium]